MSIEIMRKIMIVIFMMTIILTGCYENSNNIKNQQNNFGTLKTNVKEDKIEPTSPTLEPENTTIIAKSSETYVNDAVEDTAITTDSVKTNQQKGELALECIKQTKTNILKKLGNNYEIVNTGAEGSYEGYYYRELGILITYRYENDANSPVEWIECDDSVEINGVRNGMDFIHIQEKLGKSIIYDTWMETSDNKAYEINYVIKDCIINFFSYSEDGTNSAMTIYKETWRYVGSSVNGKEEVFFWHISNLTGVLRKIEIYGEKEQLFDFNKTYIKGRIIKVSENLGNMTLQPCCIIATENQDVFGIYSGYKNNDFREFRTRDDEGIAFGKIDDVECYIDTNTDKPQYKIKVTTNNTKKPIRILEVLNEGVNNMWMDIS